MAEPASPYLNKKEIPLDALKAAARSKIYVRRAAIVLFDEEGEDSGE